MMSRLLRGMFSFAVGLPGLWFEDETTAWMQESVNAVEEVMDGLVSALHVCMYVCMYVYMYVCGRGEEHSSQ